LWNNPKLLFDPFQIAQQLIFVGDSHQIDSIAEFSSLDGLDIFGYVFHALHHSSVGIQDLNVHAGNAGILFDPEVAIGWVGIHFNSGLS
jgi:hypothetical protein